MHDFILGTDAKYKLCFYCLSEAVMCESLVSPSGGAVNLTGLELGSRAEYRCELGALLIGNRTRVCMENGNWTGSTPSCVPSKLKKKSCPLNFFLIVTNYFQKYLLLKATLEALYYFCLFQ